MVKKTDFLSSDLPASILRKRFRKQFLKSAVVPKFVKLCGQCDESFYVVNIIQAKASLLDSKGNELRVKTAEILPKKRRRRKKRVLKTDRAEERAAA